MTNLNYTDAKPVRTIGWKARDYARNGINFRNSNGQLYGHWVSPSLYVVFSYGEHWPLFIYSTDTRCWYANEDKTSRTTSIHYSQTHPLTATPPAKRSCTWMKEAIRKGAGFILLSHCEEAQKEQEAA